jgi:hypothetical protein
MLAKQSSNGLNVMKEGRFNGLQELYHRSGPNFSLRRRASDRQIELAAQVSLGHQAPPSGDLLKNIRSDESTWHDPDRWFPRDP